jgi:hypothetical protein
MGCSFGDGKRENRNMRVMMCGNKERKMRRWCTSARGTDRMEKRGSREKSREKTPGRGREEGTFVVRGGSQRHEVSTSEISSWAILFAVVDLPIANTEQTGYG